LAIVPEDADSSELLARVTAEDESLRMPPEGKPLSAQEVDVLRRWIDEGAEYRKHWAFVPPAQREPPAIEGANQSWVRTPIDAFILAQLQANNLQPAPRADKRTLCRRAYFDLTGLPPTFEAVESFVRDNDPGAYERIVEHLLNSPHYGERWARHWLDVAHYGDTHGYDKDKVRPNAWPYRDYVIRSLNQDKPYGRFVKEQLAGDAFSPENADGVLGLGFIAAGPFDYVGHIEVKNGTMEKTRVKNIDRDDMVSVTMNTFVSLTVHCARCHDHKFDPVPTADYYSLYGVFAGSVEPEDPPLLGGEDDSPQRRAFQKRFDELREQAESFRRTKRGELLDELRGSVARYSDSAPP
jgi:hypothetical protein